MVYIYMEKTEMQLSMETRSQRHHMFDNILFGLRNHLKMYKKVKGNKIEEEFVN